MPALRVGLWKASWTSWLSARLPTWHPLIGENRALVRRGLETIRLGRRQGLLSLAAVCDDEDRKDHSQSDRLCPGAKA